MSKARQLKTHFKRSYFDERDQKHVRKMMRDLVRTEKCMGKVSRSELDAHAAIEYYWQRDGVELRAYRCRLGDHWHLTSQL